MSRTQLFTTSCHFVRQKVYSSKHMIFYYISNHIFWNLTWISRHTELNIYCIYTFFCIHNSNEFYVLLTVHLGIIFVNNQLDAQFFFVYVYFYSLHVSASHVPIIERINCIRRTKRSSMQSNIYQMSY